MSLHVVITGARAGIGAATARVLAGHGHRLSLGARRLEELQEAFPAAFCAHLDVTSEDSVEAFLAAARRQNGPIDVLVNNAGLARGRDKVAEADPAHWREMVETNVMGVLHVTRRVLPAMVERGSGHVIMLGSLAAYDTYPGGSVYCATKRALQSIAEAIRLETLGTGVRVSSIDPGLVETEFSLVRFDGDARRAAEVYRGTRPLRAEDVAECIAFAVSRPAHVNIDVMLIKPTDQATTTLVHRPG